MAFVEALDAGEDAANYERLLAHRPEIYEAWKQLVGAVRSNIDLRTYELATLAAARRLRSSYCSLAHGTVLAEQVFDWDTVRGIAAGELETLSERDVAVMQYAEKIVADASSVTQADVDRLRALGLSDAEVVDVAASAAIRCFFSKLLDALGAEPDAKFNELDPAIRDVLVVGRPIAAS
jgi:uncharacterized peroxidase-related enzyme